MKYFRIAASIVILLYCLICGEIELKHFVSCILFLSIILIDFLFEDKKKRRSV